MSVCLLYLFEVVTPTSSSLQAIHARSLLPCPDTPASKLTYNAEVTVKDSRYTVLMSALSRGRKSYMGIANTFLFEQPVRAQQSHHGWVEPTLQPVPKLTTSLLYAHSVAATAAVAGAHCALPHRHCHWPPEEP